MKFKKHDLIRMDYGKTGFRYSCKNCHIDYKTKPKNVCGAKIEDKKTMGKHSRAAGKRFETKVREDLEKDGWIVVRWDKNIEGTCPKEHNLNCLTLPPFKEGKLVRIKPKFNPFTKSLMMNSGGFPDFICFKEGLFDTPMGIKMRLTPPAFEVQFVECKIGKYLDKTEKDKVEWIKESLKIPVFIASKGKKRGTINYEN